MLAELELRGEAGEFLSLLGDRLSLGERFGHRLAVQLGELRLAVKGFEMRRPAGRRENTQLALATMTSERICRGGCPIHQARKRDRLSPSPNGQETHAAIEAEGFMTPFIILKR